MHTFAVIALLALATVKLVDVLADNVPAADRLRSVLTYVLAVGACIWLDFSLFQGYDTPIRDHTLGLWVTGLMVAGMTVPWRALFSYLTNDRAQSDETLGRRTPIMRKVA